MESGPEPKNRRFCACPKDRSVITYSLALPSPLRNIPNDVGVLHFSEKSFRNLKWTGHVQFPEDGGLLATLRCAGADRTDDDDDRGKHFSCHVVWIRLTSSKGRVISVETPPVPYVITDDARDRKGLQITISAPFSPSDLSKLCWETDAERGDSNNNKYLKSQTVSSRIIELYLDFSIGDIDWYGGWQL